MTIHVFHRISWKNNFFKNKKLTFWRLDFYACSPMFSSRTLFIAILVPFECGAHTQHTQNTHTYIHTNKHKYLYNMYRYIYIITYYKDIYVYLCVCVYVCVCMYVCMYAPHSNATRIAIKRVLLLKIGE